MTNFFSYNILTFVLAWLSNINDIEVNFFKVIYLSPCTSN
jgi:hypothetical protein